MEKFISLVKAMRKAQKKYFLNRNYENLMAAKRLETEVDKKIKNMELKPVENQGNLL